MPVSITITPNNINNVSRGLRQARRDLFGLMVQEFRNAGPGLEDIVMRHSPIGHTGQLRQLTAAEVHINSQRREVALVLSQPARNRRTGFLYLSAVSGPPVPGGGRLPGLRPPYQDLMPWVRSKLQVPDRRVRQVAYLVARKIGRQGSQGNPYYRQVLQDSMPILQRTANNIGRRITARLTRL